jgi:glycine/D-amino acid oxidase-like deaminating enzyme
LPAATVIGAGAFGAWTARALHVRGWAVTLVDQHGPANSRASSGGETRIIRSGYGDIALYAAWARDSLPQWLELQRAAGEPLFAHTGALFLGRQVEWLKQTLATLEAERVPAEWLDPSELATRFPQLQFADSAGGVFEPRAGVLFARRAVQALVRTLTADGVVYEQRTVDPARELASSHADAVVFACGAWLPSLFPDLLGDAILPTRQEVFFFGAPAGDTRFTPDRLPAWVAFDEGVYGVPDLEHRGVKIAFDAHGELADPERMDRGVPEASVERMRDVLKRRLPALANAPLVEARVCQYENTTNGHLLIDRLPGHERAWIAGGGSGHGFKHGPAVGAYLAGLIEGTTTPNPLLALGGRPPRLRSVY